jgi:uncharacterized sulfatase
MDGQAAEVLRQLDADGLTDSTIVFFYGDHGSGMPRSKRWPYDSGLRVPLIVHVPERFRRLAPPDYKPGGSTDRLVSFVDLAPTLLSLAGVRAPAHMQGHAFLGEHQAPEQPYLYGFRGRMDERYDLVRSVRDQRYVYVRNYMPHKIYGQHIAYMFETPTTRVWKELYDRGKLKPEQARFWETKPPEELYDLQNDPDEVRNLAQSPEHQKIAARMRKAQEDLALHIRDVGFLPEGEIHSRSAGSTPYEIARQSRSYPIGGITEAADLASRLEPRAAARLRKLLADAEPAVRYWAALGLLMRGSDAVRSSEQPLRKALADSSPYVRVTAAEALGRYGAADDLKKSLAVLMELAPPDKNGVFVSMAALNAIDALGEKAAPVREAVARLPQQDPNAHQRYAGYVPRLIDSITSGRS